MRAATATLFGYAAWASLRRPAPRGPAKLAMGSGVVRLEPNRLLSALGQPGVEVGAR